MQRNAEREKAWVLRIGQDECPWAQYRPQVAASSAGHSNGPWLHSAQLACIQEAAMPNSESNWPDCADDFVVRRTFLRASLATTAALAYATLPKYARADDTPKDTPE